MAESVSASRFHLDDVDSENLALLYQGGRIGMVGDGTEEWLADNGASHHTTGSMDNMFDRRPPPAGNEYCCRELEGQVSHAEDILRPSFRVLRTTDRRLRVRRYSDQFVFFAPSTEEARYSTECIRSLFL